MGPEAWSSCRVVRGSSITREGQRERVREREREREKREPDRERERELVRERQRDRDRQRESYRRVVRGSSIITRSVPAL